MKSIFIYGDVASSKNSKRAFIVGKFKKRAIITESKYSGSYKKSVDGQFIARRHDFHKIIFLKPMPLHIKFRFVRKTKRRFDFINLAQILQDLMVKHEWITDDDFLNIIQNRFTKLNSLQKIIYREIQNEK